MDNPFNSSFTYPNGSDSNFYDSNPSQDTVKLPSYNKYIIIGCVLGGFTFILLCIGLVFSIKLLLRKRQNRKVKEQNWDLLQDSEYAPSGFPDTKLRHSLFDSSFTIAVQEAAKIPETPKSASPDFSFGNEKPEKR